MVCIAPAVKNKYRAEKQTLKSHIHKPTENNQYCRDISFHMTGKLDVSI
jgi:hypothetical protein